MVKLNDLVEYTNIYLSIQNYQDYCPNGLQVEGKDQVSNLISGVSASYELFEKAFFQQKADLILVHHGLFWEKYSRIIGTLKHRLAFLLKYQISLLAYHLPLDAHPEIGNNKSIASTLGLVKTQDFAFHQGKPLGILGFLPSKVRLDQLLERLRSLFSPNLLVYSYGLSWIEKIAIVSGRAPEYFVHSIQANCDLYITGEASESTLHLAKESKSHFVALGHYHSEKLGVQNLGQYLADQFNLNHVFMDIPNLV